MKAVRLGNVFGSTGSVVPILQREIAEGGPITITDAACTRFFISIHEAVRRLLCALLLNAHSAVLISEVEEPLRIVDLALFLLKNAGLDRHAIDWRFTGLRPGEKLSERMTSNEETLAASSIHGLREVLYVADSILHRLAAAIEEIDAALRVRDLARLLQAISSVVPDYVPSVRLQQQLRAHAAEGTMA